MAGDDKKKRGFLGIFYNPDQGKKDDKGGNVEEPKSESTAPRSYYLKRPMGNKETQVAPVTLTRPAAEKQQEIMDVDPTFDSLIRQALSQGTKRGINEFLDAFETLKEDIPDEEKRFRAALKFVAKAGINTAQIIASIEEKQELLETEKKAADKEFDEGAKNSVKDKTVEAESIEEAIDERTKQIESLQRELSDLQRQLEKVNQEIVAVNNQVESDKAKFDATYGAHKQNLQELFDLVSKYTKKR